MGAGPSSPFKNTILSSLDEDVIDRLALCRVELELGREIEYPGQAIEHLFFVEEFMASMRTTFIDWRPWPVIATP